MNEIVHLKYSTSSLSSLCEINSSFDTGILRIAYTGKNRNGSFISKATFEKCMDTLYNCPVVCNYDRETDSIGGHDVELVHGDDGSLRLVNVTTPVGVIPESSRHFWTTVMEDDGTEHEYLCADVLIWKRQEAYKKIKEDGITAHSMEITVKEGSMRDGVFVIDDFEFTAFCLLGDGHEPCFENSALSMFSLDGIKEQVAEMMADLKASITAIDHNGDNDTNTYSTTEGGEETLNEKLALVKEYGFDIEKLEFSVEDIELDALKERLEAMKAEFEQEPVNNSAEPEVEDHTDFALESQIREAIAEALSEETVEREWGCMSRYWFVDYDKDAGEVYCYDCEDWKLYGFTYSMDGDKAVVDFESKKQKKFAIVDFDEGEQGSPVAAAFEAVEQRYHESESAWSEKYSTAENKIASLEDEVNTLKQFKQDVEDDRRKAAVKTIFDAFEDLVGNDDFEALRKENDQYDLEALEDKCYAIRGRSQSVAKFSMEQKAPKLPVVREDLEEDDGYHGLFKKYPPKN